MSDTLKGARLLGADGSQCLTTVLLRTRFDEGLITSALIVSAPMTTGLYNVALKGRGYWTFASAARTPKEPKTYKTIDAAMSDIRKIGFLSATVELSL